MVTVRIFKITDLFLRKFSSQENAEKCRNLQTRYNYIRIYNAGLLKTFFIPAKNDQSLNNRRIKCKQTEENYKIFHSFAGNAEFCRLMRNFAEKCGRFFFRRCSMMLIER